MLYVAFFRIRIGDRSHDRSPMEFDCTAPAGRDVPTAAVADGGEHCRSLDAFSCGRTFATMAKERVCFAIIASTPHTTSLDVSQ